jgi:hypothetical protein
MYSLIIGSDVTISNIIQEQNQNVRRLFDMGCEVGIPAAHEEQKEDIWSS